MQGDLSRLEKGRFGYSSDPGLKTLHSMTASTDFKEIKVAVLSHWSLGDLFL
jgi:hypothetical protein